MKTERIHTIALTTTVIFACVVSLGTRHARAQEEHDTLEENKNAVVKTFCKEEGKLATCVGLPATDCEIEMRPFVDTCYEKIEEHKGAIKRPEGAFHSCFWSEFNKKYSEKLQLTDECFSVAKELFPLQPLPPHLEAKTKPFNTPGTKSDNRGELGY